MDNEPLFDVLFSMQFKFGAAHEYRWQKFLQSSWEFGAFPFVFSNEQMHI